MARSKMPDVVVLLPGILGSVLQKNCKDIWALSAGAMARGLFTGLASIKDLALDSDPPGVEDIGDNVTASRLMADTHLFPGFWKIDGYSRIVQTILSKFQVELGQNYFEFPYDWRRDNRLAAVQLKRLSKAWLDSWRQKSGNAKARLVLAQCVIQRCARLPLASRKLAT